MVLLLLRGLLGSAMAAGVVAPMSGSHAPPASWSADGAAMAGHAGMSPGQADGSETATVPVHLADLDAAVHCDHPAADGSTADHAGTCSACEVCHSAMMQAVWLPESPVLRLPFALPAVRSPFASAPAFGAIKPPIA